MKRLISFFISLVMVFGVVVIMPQGQITGYADSIPPSHIIARIDTHRVAIDDLYPYFTESEKVYGFISDGAIHYATGSSISETNMPSADAWYLEFVSSAAVRGINMYVIKDISMTNSGIQLSADGGYTWMYADWENSLNIADSITVDLFTDGSGSVFGTCGINLNEECQGKIVLGENSSINIGKTIIDITDFNAGTAHTVCRGILAKEIDIVCKNGSSISVNSEREGIRGALNLDNQGNVDITTYSDYGNGISGGDVIISGGGISVNSYAAYGITANKLSLTDCTLNAVTETTSSGFACLQYSELVIENSNVDIVSSTVAIKSYGESKIKNGSEVSVVDYLQGIDANGDITVENSALSITDYGTGSEEGAVIKMMPSYYWQTETFSPANLTITGSSVEIVSQDARCVSASGIINVENSVVTAKALGTNDYSDGIAAEKSIIFGENVQLYAAGNKAASAKDGFTFSSGKCFLGSAIQNDTAEITQVAIILNNGERNIPYMGSTLSDSVAKTVIIGNGTSPSPTPTPPPVPVYYDDPIRRVIVPVFGDENKVKVYAKLDGTKATIEDIKDEVLDTVIGDDVDTGVVYIDLSHLGQSIKKVALRKTTLDKIANAINDVNNDATDLEIDLTTAKIRFDAAATLELQEQTKGSTLWLVVDDVSKSTLNEVQKETANTLNVAMIIDAYLVSDGFRLCTEESNGLGYGRAKVMLPYKLKEGETPAIYTVYYLDEKGVLQELDAVYNIDEECFIFYLEHLSNYIIAYTEDKAESFDYIKCPQDTTCCIYPFYDSDPLAWYHDGVHYCIENGLMVGYPDHSFRPLGGITRAETAMTLWRIEGCPTVNDAPKFEDVSANAWYTDAVCWASAKNVMDGSEDGIFCPSAQVTREELAVILYDYAKFKGKTQSRGVEFGLSYTDAVDLSDSAEEAVKWCTANGIVRGKGDGSLAPKQISMRAESAAMFQRIRELIVLGNK